MFYVGKIEKVRFTTYLKKETLDELKKLSKDTRVPQAQYIQEAIEDLLEKYESIQELFKKHK